MLRRGLWSENRTGESLPRKLAVAAVALPHAADRGCHQRDQLLLLVPTQLSSLILVECGGRTIKEKFWVVYLGPAPFGPSCAAPSVSGTAHRVGGSASSPTKVVVSETEVR